MKRDPSDAVVAWLVFALAAVLTIVTLGRIVAGVWRKIP